MTPDVRILNPRAGNVDLRGKVDLADATNNLVMGDDPGGPMSPRMSS